MQKPFLPMLCLLTQISRMALKQRGLETVHQVRVGSGQWWALEIGETRRLNRDETTEMDLGIHRKETELGEWGAFWEERKHEVKKGDECSQKKCEEGSMSLSKEGGLWGHMTNTPKM